MTKDELLTALTQEQGRADMLAKRLHALYTQIEAGGGMFLLSGAAREFWEQKKALNWQRMNPELLRGAL